MLERFLPTPSAGVIRCSHSFRLVNFLQTARTGIPNDIAYKIVASASSTEGGRMLAARLAYECSLPFSPWWLWTVECECDASLCLTPDIACACLPVSFSRFHSAVCLLAVLTIATWILQNLCLFVRYVRIGCHLQEKNLQKVRLSMQ